MADLDRVILALGCSIPGRDMPEDCPCEFRESGGDCTSRVAEAAINLLKEQEAKQAIKHTYYVMMNRDYENPICVTHYEWLCPTCKSVLCRDIDVIDDNYHFCKVCGQAVKWNESA